MWRIRLWMMKIWKKTRPTGKPVWKNILTMQFMDQEHPHSLLVLPRFFRRSNRILTSSNRRWRLANYYKIVLSWQQRWPTRTFLLVCQDSKGMWKLKFRRSRKHMLPPLLCYWRLHDEFLFCGMVDKRKSYFQPGSLSEILIIGNLRTGFEPAQNLNSGFVEWSCAVLVTTITRRHGASQLTHVSRSLKGNKSAIDFTGLMNLSKDG